MNKKKLVFMMILLIITLNLSCSDKNIKDTRVDLQKTTELKMCYVTFTMVPKDVELVTEEINKILKTKINATIKIEPIIASEYLQQINLKLNRNENLDIFVTGTLSGMFDYVSQASNGQLFPLDNLINNKGKGILSVLGEENLKVSMVGGQVFGLPTIKDMATARGINVEKEIVDKYNIDIKNINTMDDVEALMKLMKEKEPDKYFGVTGGTTLVDNFGVVTFGDNLGDGLGILMNTEDLKVVNYYETPEYESLLKVIRRWYKLGYIWPEIVTTKESDALFMQLNKIYGSTAIVNPMSKYLQSRIIGSQIVAVEITPAIASTSTVTNFMWAIPRYSKNAEKAMEFLNLMYTDKDIINLLSYGIEGKHYEKVPNTENMINFNLSEDGYSLNQEFMFGNEFLAYVSAGNPSDIWNQIENYNKTAIKSKALGFMFDAATVKNEYVAVATVVSEYKLALETGVVDPEIVLPEFIEKLKAAGINEIIEEKQRQLDKWAKNNKLSN